MTEKTIYDQLAEEEKLLENPVIDDVVTDLEPTPEPVEDEVEDDKADEPVVDPKPADPVPDTNMAQIRYELSEMKRQAAADKATAAAQQAIQNQPKPNDDPEPNKTEDREEWLEWKSRQLEKTVSSINEWKQTQENQRQQNELIQSAIQEFTGYEERFKAKAPDYDQAAAFYQAKVKDSIMTLNPQLNEAQVNQIMTKQLLTIGSTFANQGLDPAEAIYNIAKRQGFKAPEPEFKADAKQAKPSLETIEKNKKKSAHGLGGSGGKGSITPESLNGMTIKDMQSMDPDEVDRIMYGQA